MRLETTFTFQFISENEIFYFCLIFQLVSKTAEMTTTPQKLCLNWKNFQNNISTAFRELRSDTDFTDVTLACEDGQILSAHKVILASSSPFFMNILKTYKNPNPLIFMRGVKSEELSSIVDFLYFGEVNIEQENLESFLAVAEDLKILGLTRTADQDQDRQGPGLTRTREGLANKTEKTPSIPTIKVEEDIENQNNPEEDLEMVINDPNSLLETLTTPPPDANLPKMADEDDTRTKVMSMMEFSEKKVMSNKKPGTTLGRERICKVCGKEGTMSTVWNHIEAKHLENSYSCNHCGKISRTRNGLAQHRASQHTK